MKNRVEVGQRWSTNNIRSYASGDRVHFVIEAIDGAIARVRFLGLAQRGKRRRGEKSLRSLRRGLCGARLEREADGRAVKPPKRRLHMPRAEPLEKTTASDHRKTRAPAGLTKAERKRWQETGDLGKTVE